MDGDGDGGGGELEYRPCPALPLQAHALAEVVRGRQDEVLAAPGTQLEIRCERGYRNALKQPCVHTTLRCSGGVWLGDLPNCVPVDGCLPPPSVPNGRILGQMGGGPSGVGGAPRFPPRTQVLYQCLPGFELHGGRVLTCSPSGCWEPILHHPKCHPDAQYTDEYMSTSGTLLVSIATASGVMLILLAVCLVVVCRRRKPWGRQPLTEAAASHHHRTHLHPHAAVAAVGDAASALGAAHDPDRLALIAFADGMQGAGHQQSGLPSYEEAVRERSGGPGVGPGGGGANLLGYRSHRAHWTALGAARRPRPPGAGATQASDPHVTRQSSCTSHSASMRSGSAGDPMGSTDTMTPSEVSTNVTLDTVSSHSGSQPASCRAICGSLASFDTSSVLNTEGVPLLEENEIEELQSAETGSLGVEHRSIADNASFKYRRASPDIA